MRTPSLAVEFKSENARLNEENRQLRESWDRCKADNARLERERTEAYRQVDSAWNERDTLLERDQQHLDRIQALESLLREVLEHNTPSLELRERIRAQVGGTSPHLGGETETENAA